MNDFEGETYGNWQVTGNAFGSGPTDRLWPVNFRINELIGTKVASSFHNSESGVGTLMSPKFKIERRYINFLVAGGRFPDSTGLHLLVDDEVVLKSTGNNQNNLEWQTWEVWDFKGKSVQIMIFDFAAGKEGYIMVDHIVQSDVSAVKAKSDLQKQFSFNKRYLQLPVKTGAERIQIACETYTWQMLRESYKGKLDHIMRVASAASFAGSEPETSLFGDLSDPIKMKETLARHNLELAVLCHMEDWSQPKETESERSRAQQWIAYLSYFPDTIYLPVQMPGTDRGHIQERRRNLLSCVNEITERASARGIVLP